MASSLAIIGAGTGGLAAALLHHALGHAVTVYERVERPAAVGAGILLQPTGMAVLRHLGLLDRVLSHGARVDRLRGVTVGGRVVLDLAYADLDPASFGLGLHRGALFATLWDAVRAAGIPVRTGHDVRRLVEHATHVTVDGERHDRAIVADGARSRLRPPWATTTPYPWGALWFLFPTPAASPIAAPVLAQVYRDTRNMLGFLPTGTTPDAPGTPLTSLFWSVRADRAEAVRRAGLDAFRAEVRRLSPDAPLDGLVDADQLLFAPYFDTRMRRWTSPRVAWIGDAAHAMSPQLGQGANLALVDALVLSRCADWADYTARRAAHLGFYQAASKGLTPFFQSSYPVLAPLRDAFAPLFKAWPWYERQMLESLAGTKTGVFAPPLRLD